MLGRNALVVSVGCLLAGAQALSGQAAPTEPVADEVELLTVEHYVPVVSEAPSIAGEVALLYTRERLHPSAVLRQRSLEGRVVLFVHGAGTPSEVAFDAPGASWMQYLAEAGYDTFAMDMTGYGRSTRPLAMNDPCNFSDQDQRDLIPGVLSESCPPTLEAPVTTIESDWHDLDAVVEYVRALRNVERVHLVGWSLGGPRAGGYAARHPEKVASIILLAPAYRRDTGAATPAAAAPAPRPAMSKQFRRDFDAIWDRQIGCANQFDRSVRDAVWQSMLESDPVGATWGTGLRRAPRVGTQGWSSTELAGQDTPMLLFAPEHDGQVAPEQVFQLYEDLVAEHKIVAHVECSSHYAMWENNRDLLFEASLEWLGRGTVGGIPSGEVRLTQVLGPGR